MNHWKPKPREYRKAFPRLISCEFCGHETVKVSHRVRFCSIECKQKARAERRKQPRTCKQCGATFQSIRGQFCTPRCWYAFTKEHSERATRKCAVCGGPTRKNKLIKTCSLDCFRKLRASTAICQQCGCEFRRNNFDLKQFEKRFCSVTCRNRGITKRGPENPLWRGNRDSDRGVTWPTASKAARERDVHTCQAPGCAAPADTSAIPVDHIIPFVLGKQIAARDPLYNPNHQRNLICLCRSHHSRKTAIERRLLRGDIIGFVAEAKVVIPLEKLIDAMRYSELPVPQGMSA